MLAIHLIVVGVALRTTAAGKRVPIDTILEFSLIAAPPPIPALPRPSPHGPMRVRAATTAPGPTITHVVS